MPDPQTAELTPEQLETIRARSPHLVAVDRHEGLAATARNLEHQEVLTFGLADARESAWLESIQHPEDPALFDRALALSIEHAEKSIALDQARIQYYVETRSVAREAVMRSQIAVVSR